MNLISNMERKFGRYAIRNLTLYLIIGYGIGYLLLVFCPNVLFMLTLDPRAVMHGQVWRLVTWIITPPSMDFSILTFVMLFFYYSLGTLLERTIGPFLYNLYMFSSMIFTMLGLMIAHILCYYVFHYSYTSNRIYLASSGTIVMKYLSIVYILMTLYYFIQETFMGRVNIAMSLVSFVIFYLSTKNFRRFAPKQMKRRRNYNRQVRNAKRENIGHRCVVCGRTDKEYPDLQFRYCSKCTGNKEYICSHIHTTKI